MVRNFLSTNKVKLFKIDSGFLFKQWIIYSQSSLIPEKIYHKLLDRPWGVLNGRKEKNIIPFFFSQSVSFPNSGLKQRDVGMLRHEVLLNTLYIYKSSANPVEDA